MNGWLRQRREPLLNAIKIIITKGAMSNKGTTADAPGRCNRMLASDWNCFYFYTLHSILFTILVRHSLNCGYYVQVGYVPATRT